MRHQPNLETHVAATWPSPFEALAAPAPDGANPEVEPVAAAHAPTPAAPDVPAGVGGLIVASYVGLVLTFFAFFAGSPESAFAIFVAALFVAIFFAVPRLFFRVEPDDSRRPSLPVFMDRGIETLTGHSSGRAALVQMLIVPVLLTMGLLAMGIAGKIYL